jgi:molecular chaperone GrpE
MENQKEQPAEEKEFLDAAENTAEQPDAETRQATTETDGTVKLASELAEMKEKYVRLYSDFENFRRRTSKEKLDTLKSANEEMMVALLPVLDDFERAIKFSGDTDTTHAAQEGLQIVYYKLYKTLEQKGLKPMESKGQAFNPDLHEAITQSPAPSPDLKGKIIDEVEKGYLLNDKVIRFAKVIIGS